MVASVHFCSAHIIKEKKVYKEKYFSSYFKYLEITSTTVYSISGSLFPSVPDLTDTPLRTNNYVCIPISFQPRIEPGTSAGLLNINDYLCIMQSHSKGGSKKTGTPLNKETSKTPVCFNRHLCMCSQLQVVSQVSNTWL